MSNFELATGATTLAYWDGSSTGTAGEGVILCDASGGAFTVTLPPAASALGRHYHIKKTDSSGNAVTVDGNGSETIDGATTLSITLQYESYSIACNGTAWFVI